MSLAVLALPVAAQQAADTLLEKGDQYIVAGRPALARVEYEKAIRAGAKLDQDFSRSRSLGLAYLNGAPHDFVKASQWLGNALRLRPGDEEVRLALAQAFSWSGNPTIAIQHWRTLWVHTPQNMDYALGLADAMWASGNKQACFDHLQHLVESSPSNLAVRLEYARLLGYTKDYSAASVQYQSVLQIDPGNLDAQVGMAKLLSWQESYAASIERYDAVLKRSPRFYPAVVGKAYSLLWMGKDEEARKYFQMAQRQSPRDPEVLEPLKKLNAEADKLAKQNEKPEALPSGSPSKVAAVPAPAAKPSTEQHAAVVAKNEPPAPVAAKSEVASSRPALVAVAVPAAPVADPVPDPVKELLASAEAASARSDFAAAIADYRKALELSPGNPEISIQLARVLSWAKQYDASLAEYGSVLGELKAKNTQARLERARVLSWAQRYGESISEYETLAKELDASPAQGVTTREVRLELARVESWARQYDQSLQELARLIPATPTAADKPALLLRARVLSYARRYPQSIAAYNKVLVLDPRDKEARFGMAQVLFWSGDLRRSRPMLRNIVLEEPDNPDARLTLASVENGSGNPTKALSLLQPLPDTGEVHTLRAAIQQSMRPVLRERIGWENDIEAPPGAQPSTTTRGLRFSSAYEFSLTPGVRMEISNTLTRDTTSNPTLARYGSSAFAQETMFRVTLQPRPWLRLSAGAGVGTTGAGAACPQPAGSCSPAGSAAHLQRPVFDLHPVITWNNLRVDLSSSRHVADYTPLAVHDNVVQLRQQASVSYQFEHVRVGGEYHYLNYTVEPGDATPALVRRLGANSHGGLAYVTPRIYRSERVTVEAGMRYDAFGYDGGAEQIAQAIPGGYGTAGFFTPRVYERTSATGHIALEMKRQFHVELDGSFGPQRIFGFQALQPPPAKWGTTGTTTILVSKRIGRLQPYISYDYFSTATAAGPTLSDGSYSSHSVNGGFSLRF